MCICFKQALVQANQPCSLLFLSIAVLPSCLAGSEVLISVVVRLSRCPYPATDNILHVVAEEWKLPDPANNHCSSLCAPVQCLMLQKHIDPSVLDPKVIMPEEIPNNTRRHVFEIVLLQYCGGHSRMKQREQTF